MNNEELYIELKRVRIEIISFLISNFTNFFHFYLFFYYFTIFKLWNEKLLTSGIFNSSKNYPYNLYGGGAHFRTTNPNMIAKDNALNNNYIRKTILI